MKKRSLIPNVDRDAVIAGMMRPAPGAVTMIEGQSQNWLRENVPGLAAMIPTTPGRDVSNDKPRTALPDGANAAHIRGDGAQVWWPYNSANTPEAFQESLKERNLHLARVTAEDARDSHTQHWAAKRRGGYHPILREGEYIVVNDRGSAFRLNDHSLGHETREVRAFMANLDQKPVQSLRELQNAVHERRLREVDPISADFMGTGGRVGPKLPLGRIERAAERSVGKAFDFLATAFESLFAPKITPEERRLAEAMEHEREAATEQAERRRGGSDRDR
jgi:hypothetical protein